MSSKTTEFDREVHSTPCLLVGGRLVPSVTIRIHLNAVRTALERWRAVCRPVLCVRWLPVSTEPLPAVGLSLWTHAQLQQYGMDIQNPNFVLLGKKYFSLRTYVHIPGTSIVLHQLSGGGGCDPSQATGRKNHEHSGGKQQ